MHNYFQQDLNLQCLMQVKKYFFSRTWVSRGDPRTSFFKEMEGFASKMPFYSAVSLQQISYFFVCLFVFNGPNIVVCNLKCFFLYSD